MPSVIRLIVAAATFASSYAAPFEEAESVEKRGLFPRLPVFTMPALSLPGIKAVATATKPTTTTPAAASSLAGKPAPFSGTLVTGSVLGATTLTAGQTIPSGLYNPNGLIFNPFDYLPLPFTWPGKPTAPGQTPAPRRKFFPM
jgi:hypothetical protein